jgi:hypothetical protein
MTLNSNMVVGLLAPPWGEWRKTKWTTQMGVTGVHFAPMVPEYNVEEYHEGNTHGSLSNYVRLVCVMTTTTGPIPDTPDMYAQWRRLCCCCDSIPFDLLGCRPRFKPSASPYS